ncbi:MAG: glycosyltransferase family 2 protein [Parachlamydiales bacterium]|nr:glycosyltransferase family 2 protein [Parachlamydiales bacterium]
MKPRIVTIAIRSRNRPLLLKRAIKSVVNQTYTDWRLAIVNNGGEADIVDKIVSQFSIPSEKIKVIHNQEMQSRGKAINQGLEAFTGEYAAVHDDDDSWHPQFLEKCIHYLQFEKQADHVAGVVSYTRVVKERIEKDKIIEIDSSQEFNRDASLLFMKAQANLQNENLGDESIRTLGAVRLTDMLRWCLFTPISFLYEQRVFKTLGHYDEKLNIPEDYDFVIRFLTHFSIGIVPEYLANYHHRLFQGSAGYINTTVSDARILSDQVNAMASGWLIEDLAKHQVGLGVLMNLVKQNDIIIDQNSRILELLKKIK